MDFRVSQIDEVTFVCSDELAAMYKLSPCVWRDGDRIDLLLRVVNRSDIAAEKVARIHYGSARDGLTFALHEAPVIAPGDDDAEDSGGCEDPSLARDGDAYQVYYSGWNESRKRGELLRANGPDVRNLAKRGIALASSERAANPKEAEIVRAADGTWRLFFEYAHDNKSKIGIARSDRVDGPWEVSDPLFSSREGSWDDWHLSTGPIVETGNGTRVMFYNGANRSAHWRIGWIAFDANYARVVERSHGPLVIPNIKRNADDTDIAFAASAITAGDDIHLYYSVADQYVMRAVVCATG